ncbi:hypothetical protein M1373_03630 [Candidatus Marsarchaeota archaeon]|nr:hypothetical protein [Candidatus Marsarchaeota archaeon]MCL5405010.1 hypothetical protein [Candidatus Marsarchaeota archaeon]
MATVTRATVYKINGSEVEAVERNVWSLSNFILNEKYASGLVKFRLTEKPKINTGYGHYNIIMESPTMTLHQGTAKIIGVCNTEAYQLTVKLSMMMGLAIERSGYADAIMYLYKEPSTENLQSRGEQVRLVSNMQKQQQSYARYDIKSALRTDLNFKSHPESTITLLYEAPFIEKATGRAVTNNIILKDLPMGKKEIEHILDKKVIAKLTDF